MNLSQYLHDPGQPGDRLLVLQHSVTPQQQYDLMRSPALVEQLRHPRDPLFAKPVIHPRFRYVGIPNPRARKCLAPGMLQKHIMADRVNICAAFPYANLLMRMSLQKCRDIALPSSHVLLFCNLNYFNMENCKTSNQFQVYIDVRSGIPELFLFLPFYTFGT